MKLTPLISISTSQTFSELFPVEDGVLEKITEDMREHGYNPGLPVHVWEQGDDLIVLDGHTRLQAAKDAGLTEIPIEIIDVADEGAALDYAIRMQRDRRNLSREQLRAFVARAVEKMDARYKRGRKKAPMGAFFPSQENLNKSAGNVAEKLGTSPRNVERLRQVYDSGDNELIDGVKSGKISPRAAENKLQEKDLDLQNLAIDRGLLEENGRDKKTVAKQKFNRVNENIDWSKWSWNPYTGCKMNCEYCYARDIANRFWDGDFTPQLRPNRLDAPKNTTPTNEPGGDTVFVCSMADLFAPWVDSEDIKRIFEVCQVESQWKYLFLTKNPARYEEFSPFPENFWMGATVDCQERVAPTLAAFSRFEAKVKFVSCEPMTERIFFPHFNGVDWLIIGARSRTSRMPEAQPKWKDLMVLTATAMKASVPIYWKPNLTVRPRAYPK